MWQYSTKHKLSSQIFHDGTLVPWQGDLLLEVFLVTFVMGCVYVSMSFSMFAWFIDAHADLTVLSKSTQSIGHTWLYCF